MKGLKFMLCAATAAMMMTACSDDQTSFNIDKVSGEAVIKGTVAYSTGATLENGKFVYDFLPAANLELYFTVENDSYDNALVGQTIFSTVTDAEGNYEITLPASVKNMNVSVTSEAFEGVENYVKIENGNPVQAQRNVVYRANEKNVSVNDHDIKFLNLLCATTSTESEFVNYNEHATLSVLIGQNAEYYIAPEKEYYELEEEDGTTKQIWIGMKDAVIEKVFVPAANVDLVVSIDYDDPNISGQVEYNVTTGADGIFTLQVPVQDFPATFSYTIEALNYSGTFTHYVKETVDYEIPYQYEVPEGEETPEPYEGTYVDYKPQTITGWYEASGKVTEYDVNYPVSSVTLSREYKLMYFHATSTALEGLDPAYNADAFEGKPWLADLLKELEEEKAAENK